MVYKADTAWLHGRVWGRRWRYLLRVRSDYTSVFLVQLLVPLWISFRRRNTLRIVMDLGGSSDSPFGAAVSYGVFVRVSKLMTS